MRPSSPRSASRSWSPPSWGCSFGHWVDEQLGLTVPIFVIVGFLLGAGSGTVMIYRLVSRFLETID